MKRIVICCDGTGNDIDEKNENISNVLKLFRCLRKTDKTMPRQLVYYDPGVGTLSRPNPWRRLWQELFAIFGLMTAYGLDEHLLAAYEFLVDSYEDGDEIFLFGFSRGAHTVRILAGLIHDIGLLRPEQNNLAAIGLDRYKQASVSTELDRPFRSRLIEDDTIDDEIWTVTREAFRARHFGSVVSSRWPTIRMIGVWDTVASVIVPRRDRLYFPMLEGHLRFTLQNPSVKTFRHAISIDERRTMFRLKKWIEPQQFVPNRFSDLNSEPQDIKQVWFAGAHADVGGGYREVESSLAKYPLIWMIEEAVACGLAFNRQTVGMLAWGVERKHSMYAYVAPDVLGELHDSVSGVWRLLEYFPKTEPHKEWPKRQTRLGFYIPAAEPRFIPENAFIHESVLMRMKMRSDYRPINLPSSYRTVAMTAEL
jgi:uncharacterized protein (DUF2235 family)